MAAVVRRLGFAFDRVANAIVFSGELEDGYRFEVSFPIGHVAVTFEREARGMGYCGEPLLGSVHTVDSFLGAVEIMHERETGMSLGAIDVFDDGVTLGRPVGFSMGRTGGIDMRLVQQRALVAGKELAKIQKTRPLTDADYKRFGFSKPKPGLLKQIGKAAGGVLKTAGSVVSTVPGVGTAVGAGLKVAGAATSGENVIRAAKQGVRDIGGAMKTAGQVASYVPGVGTGIGAGLKVAGAAAQGENIVRAAQQAAVTAVPYAQLAVQAANLASDVAQGRNVLRSVVNRGIDAAGNLVPGGEATRAALAVVRAGAEGKNLARAAASEGLRYAAANVPGVSSVASKAYSSALRSVGGQAMRYAQKAVGQVRALSAQASHVRMVAGALTGGAKQLPAVGANALAALGAANQAAGMVRGARAGIVSPSRVARMAGTVQRAAESSQPVARMAVAGLRSVRV
jgi:hypothetical protein